MKMVDSSIISPGLGHPLWALLCVLLVSTSVRAEGLAREQLVRAAELLEAWDIDGAQAISREMDERDANAPARCPA